MGNQIEAIYGEGLECVHSLEHYCETIFRLAESLEQPESCMEPYALAGGLLEELAKEMKRDIPDRREVVFFPYKASLWESLESIYRKAAEEPDCDAYCVPIPYYDLEKDGSFGAFHDERGEYPEELPVVNWQEYDFALRKPDVIYIHNPWDNWNKETSVEPRFYASNLRQYTEELIYIPYFVLDDIKPDDEVAIENMKHYCFLPGVIHADKVIVQSENIRRIYINEYVKAAEEAGMTVDEAALDDKILGLGSPLLDKQQNGGLEAVEIPEAWRRIIEKPDGTNKKIILYHTSINDMLYYDKKMLVKIKEVLALFKEYQEEIALWWMPHPMLLSRLQEDREELRSSFLEIAEQFQKEGWGIYDATADYERAAIAADAYVGDWNTVVWKFHKLDKPTMLQDAERGYEDIS